jgi:hypothetical protein
VSLDAANSGTIVCIGTGPSLQRSQIDAAIRKGYRLFGCNNAFQIAPEIELLYAVNLAWWDHYYPAVRDLPCSKWTTNAAASTKYALNWIAERNAPGLSDDPEVIHHGHGGGYSLLSLAHRFGAQRVVLLGYDLKYAPDYNAAERFPGSTPRHFFGEYPLSMRHWPSAQVRGGEHVELVELYRSVARQGKLEVINATPDSALDAFPYIPIEQT